MNIASDADSITFVDEGDAWGTRFEKEHPLFPSLVPLIKEWVRAGMVMESLPELLAPAQGVEFERLEGCRFFPEGFLGQMKIQEGQVHLYIWSRRANPLDLPWWTQRCYQAIVHYSQVLKPMQERLSQVRIVWL